MRRFRDGQQPPVVDDVLDIALKSKLQRCSLHGPCVTAPLIDRQRAIAEPKSVEPVSWPEVGAWQWQSVVLDEGKKGLDSLLGGLVGRHIRFWLYRDVEPETLA